MIVGDLNGDLRVDRRDLVLMTRGLGRTGDVAFSDGDFDGDRTVGLNDLAALHGNFGFGTAGPSPLPSAVPEPSSCFLALLAAALCGYRVRRVRR
jgi:hypothetical protein